MADQERPDFHIQGSCGSGKVREFLKFKNKIQGQGIVRNFENCQKVSEI